jgi:hypothetical protein
MRHGVPKPIWVEHVDDERLDGHLAQNWDQVA